MLRLSKALCLFLNTYYSADVGQGPVTKWGLVVNASLGRRGKYLKEKKLYFRTFQAVSSSSNLIRRPTVVTK